MCLNEKVGELALFIENELRKVESIAGIEEYRENSIDFLGEILSQFVADKKMFNLEDFSAIVYDEHVLNTACHKDIFTTIYLEINEISNYKPNDKKIKKDDKIRFPELYYDLNKILEELYNLFIRNLDSNNLVWYDDNSLYVKTTVLLNDNETIVLYFRIIPTLIYYNKNNARGLMYKFNGGVEIEYPLLSIDNFNKKNKATKDIYRQIVVMFKNIILQDKKVTRLPKEIIEILLYNAPNELFKDTSKRTLLSIINFLRNNSIKNYKTIDEEDFAFTSPYRSMSPIYVKHILKVIEKFLITN